MKRGIRLVRGLATTLVLTGAGGAVAQEAPTPWEVPATKVASPPPTEASPPEGPSDATRLQALENQLAEQKKEIEAMRAERTETMIPEPSAEMERPKLHLYGFADVGGQWIHMDDGPYTALIASSPAFMLGNINLYFDARPSPSWRALVETRFGLSPHGSYNGLTRVDNRFMDTSSPSGRSYAIWSGVILERAWLQWTHDEHFALQAGYLLTPYGIWNVDHGTPTLISLVLPSLQVEEAIPQHQVGVQALGAFSHQAWELAYHAYLTNGRNLDPTEGHWRKGVGGRLILRHAGDLRVALGASGYFGSFSKDVLMLHLGTDAATGAPTATFEKSDLAQNGGFAGDEWAIGGDLSIDWSNFRFRGETMVRHVGYQDGKHEHKTWGDPSATIPNHYSHYAYGILAYRFAKHFEPFVMVDYNDSDPQISMNKWGLCFSGGLNIYFTATAMLKMQYADQRFSHSDQGQMDMKLVVARLVLVF